MHMAGLDIMRRVCLKGSHRQVMQCLLSGKAARFNYRICECGRSFLRKIMSDAACDDVTYIFAGVFIAVVSWLRMGCAIGISFEGDSRYCDCR